MAAQTRNPTSDELVTGALWTGSVGVRYQSVDDHPDTTGADSLTYGATTTDGDITFGFSAFTAPSGATISAVRVHYYDLKNGTNTSAIAGRLKVGGSYFNAVVHNPTNATWELRTDEWTTNPQTTAAWTLDDVNGTGANPLQAFGVFMDDASPSIGLASIQIEVEYTEGGGTVLTVEHAAAAFEGQNVGLLFEEAYVLPVSAAHATWEGQSLFFSLSQPYDHAEAVFEGQEVSLFQEASFTLTVDNASAVGQGQSVTMPMRFTFDPASAVFQQQVVNLTWSEAAETVTVRLPAGTGRMMVFG